MSQITVNITRLEKEKNKLSSVSSKLKSIESELNSLKTKVSHNGSSDTYKVLARRIGSTVDQINVQRNQVITMGNVVSQVSSLYKNTEKSISGNVKKANINWVQRAKDAAKSVARVYKTGVAKSVKQITDIISKVKEVYQKKGVFWKLWNTGKAVLSIVTGIVSILALFGAVGVTGGVAFPLAVIAMTYAMNGIINSVLDIWNCWGGDTEKVGKVNMLQESLQIIFGGFGKLLGNEEAGKFAGRGIYAAGSLASLFAGISVIAGKIKQAPDLAKSISGALKESKSSVSGIKSLLSEAGNIKNIQGIEELKYHVKLFSYDIPHTMDAISCASLIKNASENAKKFIKQFWGLFNDPGTEFYGTFGVPGY